MDILLLAFAGIGAAVITPLWLQMNRSSPSAGLALTTSGVVFAWEFPASISLATIGSTSVYIADAAAALFAVAAIDQLLGQRATPATSSRLATALLLLSMLSLVVGSITIDASRAIVEARPTVWCLCALAWATGINWSEYRNLRTLGNWVIAGTFALAVVAAYHVLRYGFGTTQSIIEYQSGGITLEQIGRPLVKGQAAFLGLAIVYLLSVPTNRTRSRRLTLLTGTAAVLALIVSQQRTAIAATALAALAVAAVQPRSRRVVMAFALVLVGLAVVVATQPGSSALGSAPVREFLDGSTYDARRESWGALLSDANAGTPLAVVLGHPFGSGFARIEAGTLIEYSPHNWYLTILLRTGLVGLCVLTLFLLTRLRVAISSRDVGSFASLLLMGVMGWTYGWEWFYVFGAAMTLSASASQLAPAASQSAKSRPRVQP